MLLAATLTFAALVLALHLSRVLGPAQGGYTVTAQQEIPLPAGEQMLIDVNTADAETLQKLPGIGPALAERIVAEANGPFSGAEDLTRVEGIGEKTAQDLAPYIIAGEEMTTDEDSGSR